MNVTVHRNQLNTPAFPTTEDERYWRDYLVGISSGTFLPFGEPRLEGSLRKHPEMGKYKDEMLILGKEPVGKLLTFSHRLGISVGTLWLGVWAYLLHRYSGEKDIVFGVRTSTNILPLHAVIEPASGVGAWLQEIGLGFSKSRQHQHVPLADIRQWIGVQENLFDTVMQWEEHTEIAADNESLIIVLSLGEEIRTLFRYRADRLDTHYVQEIRGQFEHVLLQMIRTPDGRLDDLTLLTGAEERQIRQQFIEPFAGLLPRKGLMDLWDEQVVKTPDAVALHFEGQPYSWRDLDGRSGLLARHLRSRGVTETSRVPVCMERSVDMIVGILGILKAGGAYVPIDPDFPQERVKYILEDIHATLVIADPAFASRFPAITDTELVVPGGDHAWGRAEEPLPFPAGQPVTDRVICIIYTSGSTGKPKGVRVGERGIVNRLYWMWAAYPFEAHEVVAWKTSLSFVDHIWELFGPLAHGVSSVLLTLDDVLDPDLLIEKLSFHGITRWVLVPSLLRALLTRTGVSAAGLEKLKYWTCSGEILPRDLVAEFYTIFPPSSHKLLNIYGSTEVTADVTCYDTSLDGVITGAGEPGGRLPIGKPIANTRLYITDRHGALAPVGLPGEICVGGLPVALGYWNRPGLTAEKFVPDPFSGLPGGKMYRTGDIGRWLPDGNVEFIGRTDQQVKIRGYRVELGEIETVLQQSRLVSQAVVLAKPDDSGNQKLVGYIEGAFDKEAVIAWLRGKLPEYMVPLQWVELERYPLTVNGKIDRQALSDPGTGNTHLQHYTSPRNEVEKALVKIWEELLGVTRPGIHDNFFERGGDSLMTMQLIILIRKSLKAETTIRILFQYPTIAGQAQFIMRSQEDQQRSIDKRNRCITPIRGDGSNRPFFVMPDRMTYDKLGTYLQENQPLYCLEMIPDVSIEENARHFIREMKTIQPHGPYNLGGHCGAGLIALEMGRQLFAEGEAVHILVLFESYGPGAVLPRTSPRYWMGKVKLYQELLSNMPLKQKMLFPFREVKRIYKGEGEFDKEYKASLKPYPGNVLLFRASVQDTYYYKNDPLMGWEGHIYGKIESVRIEGDHLTIIHEEPGVVQIAEKLREVLRVSDENGANR